MDNSAQRFLGHSKWQWVCLKEETRGVKEERAAVSRAYSPFPRKCYQILLEIEK